jgi:hypothetical protein
MLYPIELPFQVWAVFDPVVLPTELMEKKKIGADGT